MSKKIQLLIAIAALALAGASSAGASQRDNAVAQPGVAPIAALAGEFRPASDVIPSDLGTPSLGAPKYGDGEQHIAKTGIFSSIKKAAKKVGGAVKSAAKKSPVAPRKSAARPRPWRRRSPARYAKNSNSSGSPRPAIRPAVSSSRARRRRNARAAAARSRFATPPSSQPSQASRRNAEENSIHPRRRRHCVRGCRHRRRRSAKLRRLPFRRYADRRRPRRGRRPRQFSPGIGQRPRRSRRAASGSGLTLATRRPRSSSRPSRFRSFQIGRFTLIDCSDGAHGARSQRAVTHRRHCEPDHNLLYFARRWQRPRTVATKQTSTQPTQKGTPPCRRKFNY